MFIILRPGSRGSCLCFCWHVTSNMMLVRVRMMLSGTVYMPPIVAPLLAYRTMRLTVLFLNDIVIVMIVVATY